jgi:co-chaperonin GroES (HSP10)
MKIPGEIISIKPALSQILIEHLSAHETSGSDLIITKNEKETPQAYVVAIGPALDHTKLGFSVGSRVVIQGSYIPVPKPKNQERPLGIIEIHNIKAIIEERN